MTERFRMNPTLPAERIVDHPSTQLQVSNANAAT